MSSNFKLARETAHLCYLHCCSFNPQFYRSFNFLCEKIAIMSCMQWKSKHQAPPQTTCSGLILLLLWNYKQ